MLSRRLPSPDSPLPAKQCAVCPREFVPRSSFHCACSQRCAMKLVKADAKAKEQREKAEFKRRKEAVKTIAKLIAEAQAAFNAYIRERDRDKGCFVCQRPFDQSIPGRAMHAGHVRSRGAAGHLRFNEDNCMGECEGCNGPRGAKPHQIKEGAIRRIGAERFAQLENDNTPHKWGRDELRAIKQTYKAKLKELEREQG